MIKKDIVKEARTWIGTPFKHQGRVKNHGVDCLGLAIEVLSSLDYKSITENVPVKSLDDKHYSRFPLGEHLVEGVSKHLKYKCAKPKRDELEPGDLVLMAWKRDPQHVAIISDHKYGLGLIHSYSSVGKCVEHYLSDEWLNKITHVYEV